MTAVETKAEERLVRHSDAYWSVTFDLPRLNIFGPANIPRLRGRGRALEVLRGADDVNGDLAEKYGYVNRSLPDAGLNIFVDRLGRACRRTWRLHPSGVSSARLWPGRHFKSALKS
jgi:enoyl-CoA hydratase/carnithine racemase